MDAPTPNVFGDTPGGEIDHRIRAGGEIGREHKRRIGPGEGRGRRGGDPLLRGGIGEPEEAEVHLDFTGIRHHLGAGLGP